MRTETVAVGMLLLACAALFVLADDGPEADQPLTRVVKFVATRDASLAGRPTMMLRVSSKYTSAVLEIAVPNSDPAAQKADPDPAMARVIRAAKPGDYLKVTYARQDGRFVLGQVEAHTPKPCEIDPEGWEFIKTTEVTVGGQAMQAVILSKADKEQTLLVPGEKNDEGALVHDAKVLAQIAKFAAGDFADALTARAGSDTYLRGIFPYQEPQSATFVRLATARAESGAMETTATLKKGEQTLALAVPPGPGGRADPAIMSKMRSIRPNTPVQYKSVEDDGKVWLIDIQAEVQERVVGDVTMTGTFVWVGKAAETHELKAVLTPTGPGQYKAVYTFTWNRTPKTFTGTVTGNLRSGEISGTGEGDRRKFTFTGTARNGVTDFKALELIGARTSAAGHGTLRLGG